ncbi:MAG: GxxExxY protein [Phycisphaerae bacterium]|nr:GxxExxY protein [Phycisphaerae bacterium]
MNENEISKVVLDAAMTVHKELGPGLLESVYEAAICYELSALGVKVARQVAIPIRYREIEFEEGFRADVILDDKVILELKCVESVNNAHKKQLLTYLRLSDKKLGLLLNFGEPLMKQGITRVVNGLREND